jgi:hypothetical protein
MDYRHFQQLLTAKGSDEKSALVLLQDFVREYPYCQSGQLLLTRSMYLQDHVRYEQQLKRTAIATPDRSALFNLIHQEPSAAVSGSPLLVTTEGASPFQIGASDYPISVAPAISETEHPLFGGSATTGEVSRTADAPQLKSFTTTEDATVSDVAIPPHDPHDVVRQRLEALLAKKTETPANEDVSDNMEPEAFSAVSAVAAETVEEETAPVFDLAEREIALEASLLQELEKLPVIESDTLSPTIATEHVEVEKSAVPQNFSYWISRYAIAAFGQFEEISAGSTVEEIIGFPAAKPLQETSTEAEITAETATSSHLIERFIATEPRIVPQPKAAFFNPALQAKRSVEEHDDLFSETLARIYADQGNLSKARVAYEKLGLLHPEKSAYFAALIQKIDNQLNSEDI